MDFFPYESIRPEQDKLITAIKESLATRKHLLVNAPTGLGKTVAALSPCIKEAVEKEKTVLFLTSRHTHHQLALQTVKDIRKKTGKPILAVDLVGKKHLCLQPGVISLPTNRFNEYCRGMREDSLCEFYLNLKTKEQLSAKTKQALTTLKKSENLDMNQVIEESRTLKLCPYELTMLLAKEAKVIIADYYYVFHPRIREGFFKRLNKNLDETIIVVDEAHNLPERIKEVASHQLTSTVIRRAITEAEKQGQEELKEKINKIGLLLEGQSEKEEKYITKNEFIEQISQIHDIEVLIEDLEEIADKVREEQKGSSLGAISSFLENWKETGEEYARILSYDYENKNIVLRNRCLDPSLYSKEVFDNCYRAILMSGTLTPTKMYKELLGAEEATELVLKSPFPKENRLELVIPKTSTKYSLRSPEQYKEIAFILSRVLKHIPGNTAIFYPSYLLKKEIEPLVETTKTIFSEQQGFSKNEKEEFLEKFKSYKETGAVLNAVVGGSFSEGVDFPEEDLKAVVIVGIPLQKPDLEAESLIKYYDAKFGKGWDYGYLFPAFNKIMQSAGRCIRTEKDQGVVIFLDERYAWRNYAKCFPQDWDIRISMLYETMIKKFYEQ